MKIIKTTILLFPLLLSILLSGRLGAGANVWVQDGSLWLYLAHNGVLGEDGRLLKLGALRITPANGALSELAADSFKREYPTGTKPSRSFGKMRMRPTNSSSAIG